ncbi:MAG: hypothetical protein R3F53_05520 [Gammaproteobacteria bacterium]
MPTVQLIRIAHWLGIRATRLKLLLVPPASWLDDLWGYGKRNPAKKWWFDHDIVKGVTVAARGTNERDINPQRKIDPGRHKIAYYPAASMPPPDESGPVALDRKPPWPCKTCRRHQSRPASVPPVKVPYLCTTYRRRRVTIGLDKIIVQTGIRSAVSALQHGPGSMHFTKPL